MQQNVTSLAAAQYDSRQLEKIGTANIVGGLHAQQGVFDTSYPRLKSRESTKFGLLVNIVARGNGVALPASFVLQKGNGTWQIAYDSILADGLVSYGSTVALASRRASPAQANAAGVVFANPFRNLRPLSSVNPKLRR